MDHDDIIHFPIKGGYVPMSQRAVFDTFRRLNAIVVLMAEIEKLKNSNHYNDYGMSIDEHRELIERAGGRNINGISLFSIALVLYRYRVLHWTDTYGTPGMFENISILSNESMIERTDLVALEQARQTIYSMNGIPMEMVMPVELNAFSCYNIDRVNRLGIGRYGIVYPAYLVVPPLGDVAFKEFIADNDDDLEQAWREVKIASMLKHENILEVLAVLERPPGYFMPKMSMNLSSLLKRKVLERSEKSFIMLAIANGVEYLHSRIDKDSVLHRDLKPENVLVNVTYDDDIRDDYRAASPSPSSPTVTKMIKSVVSVKLADFGVSRLLRVESVANTFAGSVSWMAPEVLAGVPYGLNADVYGVGLLMTAVLSNRYHVTRSDPQHVGDRYSLDELNIDIREPYNAAVWRLIERCCDDVASNRPLMTDVVIELKSIRC